MGSIDAMALYPSLQLKPTLNICREMAIQANIEFQNVNVKEMVKYRLKLTDEEAHELNLFQFLPQKISEKGPEPTIKFFDTEDEDEEEVETDDKEINSKQAVSTPMKKLPKTRNADPRL